VNTRLEQSRPKAKESVYAQRMRESDLLALTQEQAVPFIWGKDEALADAPGKSLLNSKEFPEAFMAVRLKAVMSSAQREVLMVSPYFLPGKDGMTWFKETCSRGVTVKVLTNSLASTDVLTVQGAYDRYRKDLLRAGVELFELRPDPQRSGKSAKLYKGNTARAALHAKILVIDRETIFVGSHNIDPRSGQLDSQNGILIHSPELAAQLASVFDKVTTPEYTYRLSFKHDELIWTAEKAGTPIEYYTDPETSWWRRFKAGLLASLAPEKWL
jgi:putative cardiolipin synthase